MRFQAPGADIHTVPDEILMTAGEGFDFADLPVVKIDASDPVSMTALKPAENLR